MGYKLLWSQTNIFLGKNISLEKEIMDKVLESKISNFDKAKVLFENMKEIGGEEFQAKLKEIKDDI